MYRRRIRRTSAKLVKEFFALCRQQKEKEVPSSPLGKAADGEMKIRYLHFNVTIWNSIELNTMFEFPLLVSRDIAEKLAVPIEALRELENKDDFASVIKKNQLGFTCMEQLLPLLRPRPNMEYLVAYSSRIIPVIEYIRTHLNRKLTMEEVVMRSNMSRGGLFNLFRKTLNISPHQYIIRMRLNLAAEKLRNSDLTLGEIAEELGYPNQFLLSRNFKDTYGISPSRYRQTQAWKFN